MSKAINLIFPHQLYTENPLLENGNETYLIEEFLFFKQYQFHKQKIAFHRASMKYYQQYVAKKGFEIQYIEANNTVSDIRNFGELIQTKGITKIHFIDPTDNWLERRLKKIAKDIELEMYESPQFINSKADLITFFRSEKSSFFQTTFYKQQRKKLEILIDTEGNPVGGKWTYDTENRKKFPKGKTPPAVHFPDQSRFWEEAVTYTNTHFSDNPGQLEPQPLYPITHQQAYDWFEQFLHYRFADFGIYEDAIVKEATILNHSVLSPLINIGLLEVKTIVEHSLIYAREANIPLNSTEGFIRQIIGWREFIRGMYEVKGTYSRTRNYWNFKRKIPQSFYTGTTGIEPVDNTIKQLLKTAYTHHIERLMILGNFMLLCEFDPDEVYRWFMELFIDAYDWVMVPNIYGMSQFADGGTFATKPYIAGSNYLKKMSNYPSGDWEKIWDGLYWRFIDKQQDFFLSNPRMALMVKIYQKMPAERKQTHLENAEKFLQNL
ncbi:MAG: cryptochrome/photolyase family protein [Bacteroidales bacterium]|jgi:deoxyribodipyrimidine photolyase-related protein|nr:cryptochrome/photolyase family protein [Bacteroidales bacterium]